MKTYSKIKIIRQAKKIVRGLLGTFKGLLFYPIAWFWTNHPNDPLARAVAEILMIGFYGSSPQSLSARLLARQMSNGQLNSTFFVNQNIGKKDNLIRLLALFNLKNNNALIAIDHEGGVVQRLTKVHDMTILPSARKMSKSYQDTTEAFKLYSKAGSELRNLGFNMNLGPVLDVDDPKNLTIGIFGRSFGNDSSIIFNFASAFIKGFDSAGIVCVLKHFPGHGNSLGDSHYEPANISNSWSHEELEPYKILINIGLAKIIMCGHLRLDLYEPSGKPATLSHSIISTLLRKKMGFDGVVITDDLDMGAISRSYNRRQAIIEAIKAGNDLLMIKNLYNYDPLLPKKVLYWIRQAVKNGEISEEQVYVAAGRVKRLKQEIYPKYN